MTKKRTLLMKTEQSQKQKWKESQGSCRSFCAYRRPGILSRERDNGDFYWEVIMNPIISISYLLMSEGPKGSPWWWGHSKGMENLHVDCKGGGLSGTHGGL